MNPQIVRIIDQYLTGELSAEDKTVFEERLGSDPVLQREVNLHRGIIHTSKRSAQRQLVERAGKRYHFRKKLINSTIGVTIAVGVAVAAVALSKRSHQETKAKAGTVTKAVQEKLDSGLSFPDLAVDRKVLNAADTVIFLSDGTMLSVPENAFLLNGKVFRGEKIIQYQVARNASDIVKSGLSTTSDGRLLETGGMFALDGFTPEGKKLEINPKVGVYVEFPLNGPTENMQLFDGKVGKDGIVNWTNPKSLEQKPIPTAMKDLNFYPPGYEEKLNELKWKKEKTQRDSLYLSFEETVHEADATEGIETFIPVAQSFAPQNNSEKKIYIASSIGPESYRAGELLFKENCATCHQPHKNGTGPALFEVRRKWSDQGAQAGSIYLWVQDWQKAVSHDSYAEKVSRQKPTAQTDHFDLTQSEIDLIFDYIDSQPVRDKVQPSGENHISPSKVLAFWNSKFDNTILATKDFEKRMTAIHKTCNPAVLDVYLKNLKQELWKADECVAKMGYPEFAVFSAERVGKIDLTDEHQKNLQEFFRERLNEISERAKNDKAFARRLEQAYNKQLEGIRSDQSLKDAQRWSQNYGDEKELNYVDCLRQLGKKRPTASFTITTGAAFYNLDQFVAEKTLVRSSGKFYDVETGKTAEIHYDPLSFEIADADKFQKLFVYLLPDKLHSFERVPVSVGMATYNLNRLMSYKAVVVGINEDGYFLEQLGRVSSGELKNIKLSKVSEAQLDKVLNGLDATRLNTPAFSSSEIEWLRAEQQDFKVRRLRMEQAEFRNTLLPIVYPCKQSETGVQYDPTPVDVVEVPEM